jgi:hypothetical protein
MTIKFDIARTLGAAGVLALLVPTAALAGDRVGTLQCKLMGNGLTVLIENQQVDCNYRDSKEGADPVHYTGVLTKVGPNITINGQGELGWGVVAETADPIGPGALAGEYTGGGVSGKIGVGGGGAMLVGGSNQTFSLQPFSIEAGSGLGWNAGVEKLTLTYVPPAPPAKQKAARPRKRG